MFGLDIHICCTTSSGIVYWKPNQELKVFPPSAVIQALDMVNDPELEEAISVLRGIKNGEITCPQSANYLVPLIFPLVKKFYSDWDPLNNPSFGISLMKDWRNNLEDPSTPEFNLKGEILTGQDVYERLLLEKWMPHIRKAVSQWDYNKPEILIDLLDIWFFLLPRSIKEQILMDLVFPRLCKEIDKWDPKSNFIHKQLRPWIPVFGKRMGKLYSHVYQRLVCIAEKWHPTQSFLKKRLRPWAKLFPPELIEYFIVQNVLPKVNDFLGELSVSNRIPAKYQINLWQTLIRWKEFIHLNYIIICLETHFFPKFMIFLREWLELKPGFEEVMTWYLRWKKMVSGELLKHPAIKNYFNQAANLIHQGCSYLSSDNITD